jgi:hypothetical protein
MAKKTTLATSQQIEAAVLVIRGEKVLLDADLAKFYGVPTKVLNQAVRRNLARFPADFIFRLNKEELEKWRSQIVTSNLDAKMSLRYAPYAFTELGVAMLSSVLHSPRAVQVNIEIMRAFVRLRQILAVNSELARRLEQLEKRADGHDEQFVRVIQAIRQMMDTPPPKRKKIGFCPTEDEPASDEQKPRAKRGKVRES